MNRMRLVIKKYDNGEISSYETSNDGSEFVKDLAGNRQPGERISAFIEVSCDETEEGAQRLLDALAWLSDEATKRKAIWSATKNPQKTRSQAKHAKRVG